MHFHKLVLIVFFASGLVSLFGQANGFGLKLGPSMGFQSWGGGSKSDPLWKGHLAAFMDSESSNGKNIVYGQLGYHIRGGAVRFNAFYDLNGNRYAGGSFGMSFQNLALEIGMRRFLKLGKWKPFYGFGLRGEYTLGTKLEIYQELEEWTKKWNYGVSLRIGSEFQMSKLVKAGIELNIAPDLSNQVYIPATIRRIDPWTGQIYPGYEQATKNTSVELSFYLRFMQLIIYEDE